jgi:predicted regulator of Ras-like GTPase activity (Roadblock/LC7/MglB family)
MAEDVKAMSAALARDPSSLIFLKLGETLRHRGQLDAAARIALTGVVRHPNVAAAHDLYARILVDRGDYERAYDEWSVTLEIEARHFGAHKGLGFLCYRWEDFEAALDHLELALASDPTDRTVVQALHKVREATRRPAGAAEPAPDDVEGPSEEDLFAGLEGGRHGLLLVDRRGLVLTGGIVDQDRAVAEEVAAYLAGAAQEAERTARLLELGEWDAMVVEGEEGNIHVARPTGETLLLVARDRDVPPGRLAVLAERAARVSRRWLEEQRA